MNRIFRNQLFLLIPLLLVSFATTFANNNAEDFFILQNIEIQNFDNSIQETDYTTCTPYQQEHRNLLFLEIIDLRDSEENEEEEKYNSNKEKFKQGNYLTPSYNSYYTKNSLHTFLKKPKYFQYYFSNTCVKLHIKFQVFII
jgi:hypothetical protein